MAARPFVIFPGDAVWRVGTLSAEGGRADVIDVEGACDPTPEAAAANIAAALSGINPYCGQGVVIAFPSRWCCCASIELAGLPARNRRDAMLYRLEAQMPDAAEDVGADFIVGTSCALGVCVPAQRVLPLIEALEWAGVTVESVCPAPLLALQHLLAQGRGGDFDAIFWRDGPEADLFLLERGKPSNWYFAPAEVKDAALRLNAAGAGGSGRLRVGVVAAPSARFVEELAAACEAELVPIEDAPSLHAATVLGARDIHAGSVVPWIELRRGPLAPAAMRRVQGPLAAALAAGLFLLLSVAAALFWRSAQYDRLAQVHRREQEALFGRVFPSQDVPPDPQSRLASEYRKLQRLAGDGGDGRGLSPSALSLLHRLLTRLPRDVRILVQDLHLVDGRVYIEGQVRSHADAEALATALREGGDFHVELSRTEQLPGAAAVTFSLAATSAAPRSPEGRGMP